MENKTYTFNPDNINVKTKTWDWGHANTSKEFGKWTLVSHNNPPVEVKPPPSDEELIQRLLPHMEDKGMFQDMVEWLRKDAPKKLRKVLVDLGDFRVISWKSKGILLDYPDLCRIVYDQGFRANEVVEGRMILGPNNESVKKYFTDFPPGSRA